MNKKTNDTGLVYIGLILILIGLLYFIWHFNHAEIVSNTMRVIWCFLNWLDYSFMPDFIRNWKREALVLIKYSSIVSFSDFISFMNKIGYLFIWIAILFTLKGIKLAHNHPANRTRRKIDIATLPHIISVHSPAIIPSLYYGDKETLLLNVDSPEHRSALTPDEWVLENKLLVNGFLDKNRCEQLFIKDLGKKIHSINELSDTEKTMFSVFASRILGTGEELKIAQNLLDKLNRSCHTGQWNGKKGYPDLTLSFPAFEKYSTYKEVDSWVQKHPYPRTLLYSLHKEALLSGKLPSSHFRWLKGMDRTLFYVLNTTGRKTPFIESAAVFTQTLWEDFAFERGIKLDIPHVHDAVTGLHNYLKKSGLVSDEL